jgi:hypothetical protein
MAELSGPDPTALTTAQLYREITALRDIMETRLSAMDKASILFENNLTRVPTDTDKQIDHLRQVHDEKFLSIQKQFDERDIRAKASEVAAQTAVNAALQAQKEAAGAQNDSNAAAILKSESATVKQIDGILALLASNTKAIDDKITVINGRLDRGEGADRRTRETRTDAHMTVGSVVNIVGGVLGVISLLAMLVFGIVNLNHQTNPTVVSPAVIPVHPS